MPVSDALVIVRELTARMRINRRTPEIDVLPLQDPTSLRLFRFSHKRPARPRVCNAWLVIVIKARQHATYLRKQLHFGCLDILRHNCTTSPESPMTMRVSSRRTTSWCLTLVLASCAWLCGPHQRAAPLYEFSTRQAIHALLIDNIPRSAVPCRSFFGFNSRDRVVTW